MIRKHVSLKDLAKELNVSISTISRALKMHPDISPALSEKIRNHAQMRNYSPNPQALGLLKHQTLTVGVIVPDIVPYFYSSIISGIEAYAKEKNYFIIIASSNERYEKEKECIKNLLGLRVDGIIICLAQDTSNYMHFDQFINQEIPIVFFDRVCRANEVSTVVADNFEAAYSIVKHFYKAGARKIAHIAGPGHLNITKERVAGYLAAIKEFGLDFNDNFLLYSELNPDSASKATLQLLSNNDIPDAIFFVNDTVAYTALKIIKEKGFRIPEDIMLCGFSDEFHSTLVEPALTSVMHPTFEMGQEAMRLLINQIESDVYLLPRQIVMKTRLVVRGSTIKNILS